MDFTREPIIETIITPKDGYQLVIRSSKSTGTEHLVDAVEVISFGTTYFLRSLEKPAAFLLPFAEYEVVEKKVARAALKRPQIQKSIKIETKDKNSPQEDVESDLEMEKESKASDKSKAVRRKKAANKRLEPKERKAVSSEAGAEPKEKPAPRSILPPPTTLISDQIMRYKDYLQTEEAAPTPEEKVKAPADPVEVESILLPPPETEVSADFDKVELPLSVMKEADDFINQAQDEMFNQSLEEKSSSKEEAPVALKMNCMIPPPLIVDREE